MNGTDAASQGENALSEEVQNVADSGDNNELQLTTPATAANGEVLYLWMNRREICELLGIPSEQLLQMVDSGDVACDLSGDKPRYRLLRQMSSENTSEWPLLDLTSPGGVLGEPPPRAEARPDYLDALVSLVDQLSQQLEEAETKLAEAESIRNDAVEMAFEIDGNSNDLVEQLNAYCQSLASTSCALQETIEARNTLRRQLETMYVELRSIADSPLAFPIRNRLRSLAEGAKPLTFN